MISITENTSSRKVVKVAEQNDVLDMFRCFGRFLMNYGVYEIHYTK